MDGKQHIVVDFYEAVKLVNYELRYHDPSSDPFNCWTTLKRKIVSLMMLLCGNYDAQEAHKL